MSSVVSDNATALKDLFVQSIPEAHLSEEPTLLGKIIWLDITKGKKQAVVEVREQGFGVSDLDLAGPFEGPDHVYEKAEDACAKVIEIVRNG